MTIAAAFTKADAAGRIKRKTKPAGKEKKPAGKAAQAHQPAVHEPRHLAERRGHRTAARRLPRTDERMAWREKVDAKVVLHPLRSSS